jgi:predicted DNA-binding mobile mystery protein A
MRGEFRSLRLQELDRSLVPFRAAQNIPRPPKGWLRAVREATGISAREVGEALGASRQLPLQFERAEAEDRITLKSLRAAANALDCDLVYALVPKKGTMEELIESRAQAQSKERVPAAEDQASGS